MAGTSESHQPTVFLVDDDEAIRDSLSFLLQSVGIPCETFASARDFLNAYNDDRPGCLVLDVRMPGMSGLELQETLSRRDIRLPIIIISGHGDVPMAVRAMKAGAIDFIEKPFSGQTLLKHIRQALAQDLRNRRNQERYYAVAGRLALLSPREREVMERVVTGQYNKVIAAELGISISTVEAHRKNMMEKLQAESLTDLIRMLAYHQKHTGKP